MKYLTLLLLHILPWFGMIPGRITIEKSRRCPSRGTIDIDIMGQLPVPLRVSTYITVNHTRTPNAPCFTWERMLSFVFICFFFTVKTADGEQVF